MTLAQTFDVRDDCGKYGAGWHICLAVLVTSLDGHEIDRVIGSRAYDYGWSALRDTYDARLG